MRTNFGWKGNSRYMVYLVRRWKRGCAGKTVKSLDNACHTWAFLQWGSVTKMHYVKFISFIFLLFTFIVTDDFVAWRLMQSLCLSRSCAVQKQPNGSRSCLVRKHLENGVHCVRDPYYHRARERGGANFARYKVFRNIVCTQCGFRQITTVACFQTSASLRNKKNSFSNVAYSWLPQMRPDCWYVTRTRLLLLLLAAGKCCATRFADAMAYWSHLRYWLWKQSFMHTFTWLVQKSTEPSINGS